MIVGGRMKKKKRIDSQETVEIKKYKKIINNKFLEWVIYMIGYAVVLITVSKLFSSLYINGKYYGLYAFLASVIIYILNQTIKPILTYIAFPITVLSRGLFYPFINVLILYITSFILGKNNFQITGIFIPFLIAIVISILNILMEGFVLKPITKRKKEFPNG